MSLHLASKVGTPQARIDRLIAIDFRHFAPDRVIDLRACVAVFDALDEAWFDREIERYPGESVTVRDSAGNVRGFIPLHAS